MSRRPQVHLIVQAEFHDADFVRRELLTLLAEDDTIKVQCDSDWQNIAHVDHADCLVTYTSNVFPDAEERAALEAFLRGGGRWIAFHGSAAYTEFKPPEVNIGGIILPGLTDTPDRQPDYMNLLGCRFVSHLAQQEIEVRAVSDHPLVAGLPPMRIVDEPYVLEMRGDCQVLMESRFTGEAPGYVEGPWLEDLPRPQVLLHRLGKGEALYIAPGHACGRWDLQPFIAEMPVQSGPWLNPTFRELVRRSIRWGTRQSAISTSSPETVTA